MRKKAFTRDERKAMIVTWFAVRIQNGNENFATMNEIARGLGMSPSTHLTQILFELNNENKIAIRGTHRPGRWAGNEFMLMPGTYEQPRGRTIPVKARGLVAGQLELFK